MKRPERLRVIGKRWTVRWDYDNADEYGICDHNSQTLHIQSNLAPDTERDTLLHEVLHAVDEAMGTHLEEAQVRSLATGLLAVLADNPSFVRYLTRRDADKV